MMKTTDLPAYVECPACHVKHDCATDPNGESVPHEGAYSLCIECHAVSRFRADLSLELVDRSTLSKKTLAQMDDFILALELAEFARRRPRG